MRVFLKNLKYVWEYTKNQKKKLIIYAILSIVNIFIGIIYPIISARIIVHLTNSKIKQFIYVGIILLIGGLINDLVQYFRNILYDKIFMNVYINIQTNLGSEILKLSNKSLDENSSGVFIQRLVSDTRRISSIFTDINKYTNGIISNVGIIISYFILSKTMFFFVVIAFLIRLILEIIRINIYYENDKMYKKSNDSMTGFAGEIIKGAKDIKMLNGEESFIRELKIRFKKLNNQKYEMEKTNYLYNMIRGLWSEVSYFIILFIIGVSVMHNTMTVAVGLVIYNFGNKYNSLVSNITGFHELIKKFNLSASRIFDIFEDEKYSKETFGTKHIKNIEGNFEFENVSFKYDTKPVLSKLNFKINANETVAFVGKSGAGKTTIFNLLCKMYDNYDGTIKIDGIDIEELDKDSIRGNITIVSQNPYIFNMSIKDNLKLVKNNLTDAEMKKACKMASLDEYIESLPNKYDTVIGEGGVNLSGGQKQRLAIARAFIQKTEIILFDEATSALDNETQAKIKSAIDNLKKEYTILIIAHRLSTIKNADRILMIENGRIIAEGNHNKLIRTCKEYKELYDNEITKIDEITD